MGILKNLIDTVAGRRKSHIFKDGEVTWGFATPKDVKVVRLVSGCQLVQVFDALYTDGYDYVVTGQCFHIGNSASLAAQADMRMADWEKEENQLVAYTKITTAYNLPACCAYTGVLKADTTGDRILQMQYFTYSAEGWELFLTISKKCPVSLSVRLPNIDYNDIVKDMQDVARIVTATRIMVL